MNRFYPRSLFLFELTLGRYPYLQIIHVVSFKPCMYIIPYAMLSYRIIVTWCDVHSMPCAGMHNHTEPRRQIWNTPLPSTIQTLSFLH